MQDCSRSTNGFSNKDGEIPTSQGITHEGKTEEELLADTSKGAKIFGGAARILGCISKEACGSGILSIDGYCDIAGGATSGTKKKSRSKYRLARDLLPVNVATMRESWPMPNLDSEVLDLKGSVCLAVLEFVSAYWQLPLHPESYETCGIVGPKAFIVSKWVLPGLENATSYFQSAVESLFQEMRNNIKAWLDDFNLHAGNEEKLMTYWKCSSKCSRSMACSYEQRSVYFSRET